MSPQRAILASGSEMRTRTSGTARLKWPHLRRLSPRSRGVADAPALQEAHHAQRPREFPILYGTPLGHPRIIETLAPGIAPIRREAPRLDHRTSALSLS